MSEPVEPIYTGRFWQFGQWNYIPDVPVDNPDDVRAVMLRYHFSSYHIMTSEDEGLSWYRVKD